MQELPDAAAAAARLSVPTAVAEAAEPAAEEGLKRLEDALCLAFGCSLWITGGELAAVPNRELRERVPAHGLMVSFAIGEERWPALLAIGPRLISLLLESLLGGRPTRIEEMTRPVTDVERHLLLAPFGTLAGVLGRVLPLLGGAAFEVDEVAPGGRLLQVRSPRETMLSLEAEVHLGDTEEPLAVLLPMAIVEAWIAGERLAATAPGDPDPEAARRLMAGHVVRARVEVDVRLEGSTISVTDLLQLREGDVVMLDRPIDQEFEAHLNRQTRYRGRIVTDRRQRYFEVTGLVAPEEPAAEAAASTAAM